MAAYNDGIGDSNRRLIFSWFSMPFIPGQISGLIAGFIIIAFYSLTYLIMKAVKDPRKDYITYKAQNNRGYRAGLSTEFSKELDEENKDKDETDNQ